jgi:hypothetical protein
MGSSNIYAIMVREENESHRVIEARLWMDCLDEKNSVRSNVTWDSVNLDKGYGVYILVSIRHTKRK